MENNTLFLFFLVALSQTISVGPAVTVLLTNYFCCGVRSSVRLSLAFRCGESVVIFLAFLITSALHVSERLFLFVKVVGGIYLVYLGLATLIKGINGVKRAQILSSGQKKGTGFVQAFLIPAMNPKALVFFISFIPSFIHLKEGEGYSYSVQFLMLGLIFIVVSFISDMFFLCIAEGARRVIGEKMAVVMMFVSAVFLIGTGCFFVKGIL